MKKRNPSKPVDLKTQLNNLLFSPENPIDVSIRNYSGAIYMNFVGYLFIHEPNYSKGYYVKIFKSSNQFATISFDVKDIKSIFRNTITLNI